MSDGAAPVFRAIDRGVKTLGTERIPAINAFGRVAGRSVKAPEDMPRSNISALDGFAVLGPGETFLRIGNQEMGNAPITLREGHAVFVPTGACLPRNGRFVMVEHVREEGGHTIRIQTEEDERKEWEKGSWLEKGTFVVEKGQVINAVVMERLSLAGMSSVEVYRQATVGVMTTGDEIRAGIVPDSNRHLLAGLVQHDGGQLHHIPTAPDRAEEMADAIGSAVASLDLLVVTGGTARGKKDITRNALTEAKATFLVDRPRIIPGKTMAFGLLGEMPFFLLPGNPKAINALYELFVRRCLKRLHGVRELKRKD